MRSRNTYLCTLSSKVVYYMAKLTDSPPPKVCNFVTGKHENHSLSKIMKIVQPVITGDIAPGIPLKLIYVVGM